jgi:hypothetical protein
MNEAIDANWRASVDARLTHLDGSFASLDGRVGRLEGAVAGLDGRVGRLEGAVAGLDGRVGRLEGAVARLEGIVDGLRSAIDGLRWVTGMIAIVMVGGFSFLGFQLNRIEGRLDRVEAAVEAIPARLSEEFRSMRAEMAAQTSAIANSITATRQAQPPPPQVIVVPGPQPSQKP